MGVGKLIVDGVIFQTSLNPDTLCRYCYSFTKDIADFAKKHPDRIRKNLGNPPSIKARELNI
jgi:hypothetical protein